MSGLDSGFEGVGATSSIFTALCVRWGHPMQRRVRLMVVGALLTAIGLTACSCSTSAGQSPSTVTSSPLRGPVELSLPARWWIWSESAAPDVNPIDDSTGASCGIHQPTDVWFLAGTHGGTATRRCTVPVGRPIYFPVLNQICLATTGESAQNALQRCQASADSATATLDGKSIAPAVETSTAFPFVARPHSSTGFSAGPHQAVAWGIWVGPLPLSPGKHTVSFKGVSGSFETAVVYDLKVS
jgi:hypothetical protein